MNIKNKQQDYRRVFLGDNGEPHEAAKTVLDDLMRFVKLHETCAADPNHAYGMEMARSPVRRILNFLKIDYAQTYDILNQTGDPYE